MTSPVSQYIFFALAFFAGSALLLEACSILLLKKQFIPLPTRILYGLSVLAVGADKSRRQFAGKTTLATLHTYATWTVVLGLLMLVSSLIYLFTAIL